MRKYLDTFLLAIGAGIGIGIGGTIFLSIENRTVGALLFTVGLYLIVSNGLNLYTGKVGYLLGQDREYLAMLLVIWAGNLFGTYLAAEAVRHTRISAIADRASELCQGKLSDGPVSLFLLSVFCGILMYGAVDGYRKTKNPIILFLCVSVFILAGFEHCVANMYYFSLAGVWSVKTFLYLLVMTLGNSLGGVLLPLLHAAKEESKE